MTRKRRTAADIQRLCEQMFDIARELQPMTVRQMFYQLVSRGLIQKSEREYKNSVVRLLGNMRRNGELPFRWIADNTRWMRKPKTYGSLSSMLCSQQRFYRRALWNDQNVYCEIWLEKEALAGVLDDVTSKWDVPLMVTRGYPSISFLHSAASAIEAQEKPVRIYYFGDHDPSGVDIPRFVETSINDFACVNEMEFERVAVLPHQIEQYELQTRPTKTTDSRSKTFKGESVELDAIAPDDLRSLCERCITQNIDSEQLERTFAVEEAERDTLAQLALQIE